MIRLVVFAFTLSLVACGQSGDYSASSEDRARAAEVDEEAAKEGARSELDGTTYVGQGARYGCTSNCAGHEAGYQWAQENEIEDPSECDGRSASFIEGCEAYAEEFQERAEEIAAGGE